MGASEHLSHIEKATSRSEKDRDFVQPGLADRTARRIVIEITPDDLDGGYVATIPGLPGCASQGDTVGDALRNIAEAYEGVRHTLIALDRELPRV